VPDRLQVLIRSPPKKTPKNIILALRRREKLLPQRAQRNTEEKLLLTWIDMDRQDKSAAARLFFQMTRLVGLDARAETLRKSEKLSPQRNAEEELYLTWMGRIDRIKAGRKRLLPARLLDHLTGLLARRHKKKPYSHG